MKNSSSAADVVAAFEVTIAKLGERFVGFPWENRAMYADWVAQTYYYVSHTTALVSLAAVHFGPRNRDKHYQMIAHLTDERGHDQLALNDLKNLGYDLADFPELPETSVFYQNQYYMINYNGPVSHLGYSLALEGAAAKYCPEVFRNVAKHYGAWCADFINVHACLDQDHYADGVRDLVKLTSQDAELVLKNLEQSVMLYIAMLDGIIKRAGQRALSAA